MSFLFSNESRKKDEAPAIFKAASWEKPPLNTLSPSRVRLSVSEKRLQTCIKDRDHAFVFPGYFVSLVKRQAIFDLMGDLLTR